jgi:hypothetical protein
MNLSPCLINSCLYATRLGTWCGLALLRLINQLLSGALETLYQYSSDPLHKLVTECPITLGGHEQMTAV